jgi:hypothetical protein
MRLVARRLVNPGKATALDMLATISDLVRIELPKYERRCVVEARKAGQTWTEIAAVIGSARQNTQRKFADVDAARGTDGRSRR